MALDIDVSEVVMEENKVDPAEVKALEDEVERLEKDFRQTTDPTNRFSKEGRLNRKKQRLEILKQLMRTEDPQQ